MNEHNPPKWKRFAILAAALVGLPLAMAATDRILEGKYLRSIPGGGLITVPNTTDTMVTRTATETLSNKTLLGAGNTIWANRLMTDPSPCGGGQFVTDIAADGTLTCSTPAGSGDVTGPAASVDNELVLFSGTGGKTIKRASGNGAVSVVSGVVTQGTLSVPNGGTGGTTATNNAIAIGQGSSALSFLTVPAAGYFAASDGTEWVTKQTLGVANGGTGANSLASNSIIIGQGTSVISQLTVPGTGFAVISDGTRFTNQALPETHYWLGYFDGSVSSWSTTSTTYTDPTNTGGNALTTIYSRGLTVTAGASNVMGVTFTPPSTSAVYWVSFTLYLDNSTINDQAFARLGDSSFVIAASGVKSVAAGQRVPFTLSGVYAPSTTSPTTLKVNLAVQGGGTAETDTFPITGTITGVMMMSIVQLTL